MKKRILIFLGLAFCVYAYSWVGDVQEYQNFKDKDGVPFSDFILSFSQYGNPDDDTIRIVLIGSVKRPGIYFVDRKAILFEVINSAGLIEIKEHPVHTDLRTITIYKENGKIIKHNLVNENGEIQQDLYLLDDGDVVKLNAIAL